MNSLDLRAAVRAAPRAAPRERGERARRTAAATASRAVVSPDGELSFTYRYISRESCSQFDSLPLTSSRNAASGVEGNTTATITVASVLQGYVEPLTRSALLGAKGLPAADTAALMMNTCSYVQRALAPYDFTAQRVEALAEEIDLWLATLVREHTSVVLSRCGFGAILTAIATHGKEAAGDGVGGATLRERDDAMSPAALRSAMDTFYGELSFTYRYISRESCSQFDSLPLTSSSNADFARRSDLRTAPGAWGRWDRAARHRPRALSALTPPPSLALFSAPEPAAPRRGAHSERRANRCDVHAHLRRRARSRGGVHSVGAARSDAALTLPSAHAARHLRGLGRGIQRTLGIK